MERAIATWTLNTTAWEGSRVHPVPSVPPMIFMATDVEHAPILGKKRRPMEAFVLQINLPSLMATAQILAPYKNQPATKEDASEYFKIATT